MQGWRMTQEDAHNCISDFDPETQTSLFAVYDGHGGSEVAQYAAAHFPEFLRTLELYRDGQLDEALQEAFLGFDLTLKDEKVIQALKVLAGVDENDEDVVEDEEGMGRSERDLLVAEANMPLEELMARYSGAAALPQKAHLMAKDKHPSPMLRPKQSTSNAGSSNGSEADSNNSAADPLATNLANRLDSEQPDNDNNLNVEKELREAKVKSDSEPDSTNTEQNKNNSNQDCSDSKHSKISNGETNECIEAEDSKTVRSAKSNTDNHDKAGSSTEPDSSSDVVTVQKTFSSEADQGCSSSSSDEPVNSGSGACSEPGPSGSGSSSSSAETLGAGEGHIREVEGPSGSSEGPSGSGVKAGGSGSSSIDKPKGEEDWEEYDSEDDDDSDDDDSDDEEDYVEEDDSEDDDDDDDDEEAEEIGGIFGVKSVADGEEEHSEEPGSDSGCTAVVTLIRDSRVYVANAGDSRCVLCRAGKAVDLSFDHKPEDERERSRIEAAGGKVTNDGRVNGGLNLSRALGDHWYKRNESKPARDQMISALPDVETATLGPEDEFLIIACDGIWNSMSSQECVEFVRERLKDPLKSVKPSMVCEELFDHCLAPNTMGDGTGCDNMTCIIIVLNSSTSSSSSSNGCKITSSNISSCKRDITHLESTSEDLQPEKRTKLETDEICAEGSKLETDETRSESTKLETDET
ncbi:hypothetical protein DPMN_040456 [Dreissena polymorpha]|uniref:protein-serine/threonine phosphatase n=2 Tax=Dreissena polymorpha TaxID=45954 RepID=A0A9D4HV18_DREPO|nr:hypothetical protein DPMN_040456 [Dreissena polymorpha]